MDTVNEIENGNGTGAATLPAWMVEEPSEALRALNARLPRKWSHQLEQARKNARDGFKKYILLAHDLFAGNKAGLDGEIQYFKDYCRAAGINYSTAKSIVNRAKASEQDANETRSPASGARNFGWKCDAVTFNDLVALSHDVLEEVFHEQSDDRLKMLRFFGDFWMDHRAEYAEYEAQYKAKYEAKYEATVEHEEQVA